MELKLGISLSVSIHEGSFTRTFMELKPVFFIVAKNWSSVLLVPLWNWNNLFGVFRRKRRKVLLVPLWNWNGRSGIRCKVFLRVLLVPLWNWNLRPAEDQEQVQVFYSYLYGIETKKSVYLHIERMEFYSYLYGIETTHRCNGSGIRISFTRTFMELKLYDLLIGMTVFFVLLVPLWNWNDCCREV